MLQTLRTWDECDEALAELGRLEREQELLHLTFQEQIATLQHEIAKSLAPLEVRQAELREQLADFADANRADFGGLQSRKLPRGELGWRKSSELVVFDPQATLSLIKAFGLSDYLRVKEEIDKAALKKAPANHLEQLGASIRHRETFYLKPL